MKPARSPGAPPLTPALAPDPAPVHSAGMKAAVYDRPGPPSVFRYTDVPDPGCAPDGVVVEVRAISIEGGDVLHRAGGVVTSAPHIVG